MRMNQYNKSREYYEEISYSQKKKKKRVGLTKKFLLINTLQFFCKPLK
jgi:hypothetical protein